MHSVEKYIKFNMTFSNIEKELQKPLRNIGKIAVTKRVTVNLFGFRLRVMFWALQNPKSLYCLRNE